MAFFRSRRRLRVVVLLLLLTGIGIGAGVWRWKRPRPENPTLAGVPLAERAKDLKSPDAATRTRALRTLAAFGPKARGALPEVIAATDDREQEVSAAALLALGRMREDALPTLSAWLKAEKPKSETKDESKEREREHRWSQKRTQAVIALGYAGPCAIPLLREQLSGRNLGSDYTIRLSLAQIAGEHPETIPELATELKTLVLVGESTHLQDNFRAAARDPKVFALWKGLLKHPDADVRRFAFATLLDFYQHDPNRGDHYFFDPELIPVLASAVTDVENTHDEFERQPVPVVLLRLHAAGHPVVPALMAEFRAILDDAPTETRSPRWARRSRIVNMLIRLGPDADRLVPEFVALLKSAPPEARISVVAFLSAYEKRFATKELFVVLGGGAAAAGQPPSVLRELVVSRGGLVAHFDRAVPHIVAELAAGNADQRNDLLRVVQAIAAARRPTEPFRPYPPVPLTLVHAVADCLTEPATRDNATRCLGAFGPYGISALPELLLVLDEGNFEAVADAVREIRQTKFDSPGGGRLVVPLAPDIGGRLAAARRVFRDNPRREGLSARLAPFEARFEGDFEDPQGPRPLMRLLLAPAADRLTPQILAGLDFSHRLCDFCGGDPELFRLLLDLPNFRYFTENAAAFIERHPRQERPATAQAILRCLRRGQVGAANSLPALYPTETPKEVAELLFELLGKAKPDESPGPVLWALLKLHPLPGTWVVPDAVRQRGSPDDRRLAAAVALRWNPNDARAADALLAGLVPSRFFPATGAYSSLAAEQIAPRAATDKRAFSAVLSLIAKMGGRWWPPDGSREREFEVLYRAVRSAGPLGTERAVQAYLADSDNWALRRLVDRLIADGATTPHAVFQEAKAADKPLKVLFEFVTDETIDEAMQLQRANPGEWLVSERDTLRFPKVLPTLKVWLSDENTQLRSHAFQVLSATHPADPDVWAAAEKAYSDPRGWWIDSGSTLKYLWKLPERAIPLVRAQVRAHTGKYEYERDLRNFLGVRALRAVNEQFLADPDPVVRRIALEALGGRLRHEAAERLEGASLAPVEQVVADIFTPAVLRMVAKILSDPDAGVRAAAQDWVENNHHRYQRPPNDGTPLSVLPSDAIRPWIAVLRERLAAKPKSEVDWDAWNAVDHARGVVVRLEFSDSPDLRGYRDELVKLLPDATLRRPGNREAPPERAADLPTPKLITRFCEESPLELFFEARAELLRRAGTDPTVAEQLLTAYLTGEFWPPWRVRWHGSGARCVPVILRELAPSALPILLKHLDQMDRKPGDIVRENCVIDLIGDLGPQAKAAVPLLLTFAADARLTRRAAAREAIRKIAPEVFAELD